MSDMIKYSDAVVNMIIGVAVTSAIWIIIIVCTTSVEGNLMQQAAIDAGVAEWIIDKTTGDKKFVYLTPEKETVE